MTPYSNNRYYILHSKKKGQCSAWAPNKRFRKDELRNLASAEKMLLSIAQPDHQEYKGSNKLWKHSPMRMMKKLRFNKDKPPQYIQRKT